MRDHGLKSIVADLHNLGYSDAEIGLVVNRSGRHIGRIIEDLCPRPPKLTRIDDLPPFMRERVLRFLADEREQTVRFGRSDQALVGVSP